MALDQSYPVAGHQVVMNTIRVVWGAPISLVEDTYAEGHIVGRRQESQIVGYGLYPGDDSAGASCNGGGDNADGGESIGLAWKLLLIM